MRRILTGVTALRVVQVRGEWALECGYATSHCNQNKNWHLLSGEFTSNEEKSQMIRPNLHYEPPFGLTRT